MSHHKNRALSLLNPPWQKETIGNRWCFHAQNFKKSPVNPDELGTATFQTHTAGARMSRQHRIQKAGVSTCTRDPLVELLFRPILLDQAYRRTVCPAKLDCGMN